MSIALGSVQRWRIGAIRVVLAACALVIVVGMLFALVLPETYDLLSNSQIASRTSPGPMDLVAAPATGLAGAVEFRCARVCGEPCAGMRAGPDQAPTRPRSGRDRGPAESPRRTPRRPSAAAPGEADTGPVEPGSPRRRDRGRLGLWTGEGAEHRPHMLTEPENRGSDDVLTLVRDGLEGPPDTIGTSDPAPWCGPTWPTRLTGPLPDHVRGGIARPPPVPPARKGNRRPPPGPVVLGHRSGSLTDEAQTDLPVGIVFVGVRQPPSRQPRPQSNASYPSRGPGRRGCCRTCRWNIRRGSEIRRRPPGRPKVSATQLKARGRVRRPGLFSAESM
ncbi:DUF389 domain-containing protein [Streptomyces cinereoruber]|uniref:DUF389 domain-containing protein n=1 Tax=Streptomyces cinereoruber TaxID=67260 RepID=UPI003BF4EDFE